MVYILEQAVGVAAKLEVDVAALGPPPAHELVHTAFKREEGDHA